MGTVFHFICYAEDSIKAADATLAAIERIETLNNILSDYHPDSELNRLCNNMVSGKYTAVSDELWYLLKKAIAVSAQTRGLFDVTAGNCIKLWRRAKRKHTIPPKKAIAQCKEAGGFNNVKLATGKQVTFNVDGLKLDFGGIAKGYTADEVYKVFLKHNIERVLIDAGGDIYCGKAPPQKEGWEVIVSSGLKNKTKTLLLTQQAVATSGDMYRFFEIDGIRYSHIINPLKGKPLTKRIATTVVAPNAEKADYLASVLNVIGLKNKAKKIMKKHPKSYAFIFEKRKNKVVEKFINTKKAKP
ncbi:MAG: FAD:protein FMN transferase [Bacteroidota bacterium]